MALFMDGFDYYSGTGTDQQRSVWSGTSNGMNPTGIGTGVYGYGRYVQQNNANLIKIFSEVENTPGANWGTVYVGMHILTPTTGATFNWLTLFDGASQQLVLRFDAGRNLQLYRGNAATLLATAGVALQAAQWYWFSMKAVVNNNAGVGMVQIDVNGPGFSGNLITYNGDTAATANDYATSLRLDTSVVGSNNVYFDNFHLYDGSDGAPYNAMLSERRIYFGLADGDGSDIAWTASAGNRWECQDENPPNGDTDYIFTAGVGNRNSVTIPDLSAISPDAVKMSCQMRRDDAGPSNIALFVKDSGGTYSTGPDYATGSAFIYVPRTMILSPFTAGNWGLAEINGAEWGVQRTS